MTGASRGRSFTLAGLLVVLCVVAFVSFRLIALPLLVVALVAGFRGRCWRKWACSILFVAACLSPLDVAVPGYPGWVGGEPRPGVRLVRVVGRMPIHSELLVRYGEFMEYNGPSINPPRWVVVGWS
jgi:hypothetical protein